ncbi:hypothetical protein [Streptomyces cupreus]|uniref:Transposase n=1 Tax=Streptomyces cupreus TaxID=2759956 RepID=A0A7X1J1D7_9ACTN|nr:hypothetical protein [Streptomyces cupreus]MBC2902458.1 hypothetical protein [Streptomyces cupreus]
MTTFSKVVENLGGDFPTGAFGRTYRIWRGVADFSSILTWDDLNFEAIRMMAGGGHSVERACRVLYVAESGYYTWRNRPPSARTVRHAWLTEAIIGIHTASRGTYGVVASPTSPSAHPTLARSRRRTGGCG